MPSQEDDPTQQPLLPPPEDAPNAQPSSRSRFSQSYTNTIESLQIFLSSRTQHYMVLALVTFDVLGIFADIFISLYQCEEKGGGNRRPIWDSARNGLGIAGLVFSCLFLLELVISIWAFGWSYFQSWFHCFDATVIVASFLIDVVLKGVVEEVASLVVILRLWRFLKIVEEFSVGAEEQMDALEMRIEQLEVENNDLKRELKKQKGTLDEEEEIGLQRGSSHL
ncbi:hypothetical protein B7463_g6674, partial [Scytalidium lignicola]